ncbi:phasin family protein [Azospirillum sp. SYSU D00513]|uniref:phasin family protein n=1 Tax=Azospirillum sp. SYSU D00513 TaxID=2812561 RepID=UPI001A96EB90|nr:phasin family protein [Azospirillum sp. SYSU D00513]
MTETATVTQATAQAFQDTFAKSKSDMEGVMKAQQEQLQKAASQITKGFEDLTAFTKGNVEAVVASSTIAAKGAEEMGRQVAAFTQTSFEKSLAAGKAMMGVKTIQELATLQHGFAQSSFDTMVNEMTRLQELSVKVAGEAMAPLNARVNLAVETLAKPLNGPVNGSMNG